MSLFSQNPIVIKVGGALLENHAALENLFSVFHQLHQEFSGKFLLVHGGATQIDHLTQKCGFSIEKVDGIRKTPVEQIDYVVAALAGIVNKKLLGFALKKSIPALGLCLSDGLSLQCEITEKTKTFGQVGETLQSDGLFLKQLLQAGHFPILSSIGINGAGECLNVNADDAAVAVAAAVQAEQLIFLTDTPGVLDSQGELIPQLDSSEIKELIAQKQIQGGMVAKVRAALNASHKLRRCVSIASWKEPNNLLALTQGNPCGTQIAASF